MKIGTNDPKWTAYALGEITDEKERAEIEKILEESAEMRRLVEEIRQTAGLLREELHAEPALGLTPAQRDRIQTKATVRKRWLGLRPAWAMAGAAAALVMASLVTIKQLRRVEAIPQQKQMAAVTSKEPVQPQIRNVERRVITQTDLTSSAAKAEAEQKSAAVRPLSPAQPMTSSIPPPVMQHAVLEGTIKDASGGGIPGATIRVVDDATGSTTQAQADRTGRYIFPTLSPGLHTVIAEQPGFKQAEIKSVPIDTAAPKQLDLTMEVGGIAETVRIAADAPMLRTESASAAGGLQPMMLTGGSRMMPPRPRLMPFPRHPHDGGLLPIQRMPGKFNTEAYDRISDNPFLDVVQNPLSTFSIDVDTASYSNVRRFLDEGTLPPKDAVRIEELVNYFYYDYKGPQNDKPFAANFELAEAPWNPGHKLLRIGLKAREVKPEKRPNSNLVFLLDVSGSMADENKLPLVKESMALLVDKLTESDRVAIVVYASDTSVLLPSTNGDQKEKLRQAIDRLHAGGSTNGASGIQLAYQTAKMSFIQGGVNRVILATDGDFNVGITNRGDLTRLIEEMAKSGIYFTALGFGMGNYKDATLELLASKGHGNYAYIDTLDEAKKVLVEQIDSTLVTIAKDVKIQVEFNPRRVSSYRLIGYEDRTMAKEDFNDDTKDAGVIGAGHAVTALYELVPAGASEQKPGVDPLKYQKPPQPSSSADSNELVTIKVRSKEPEKDKSVLSEFTVKDSTEKFDQASQDFKFAAAVAAFGMVLRDSPNKGNANLERALEWAKEGKGTDRYGYRKEFIRLIHRAISIAF